MTNGELLIQELGLQKFQKSYIQKAIAVIPAVYVITVDSRHDGRPITNSMAKKIQTSVPFAVMNNVTMDTQKVTLTPIIPLEDFDGTIHSRSIIFYRDIAGEYMNGSQFYEQSNESENNVNKFKILRNTL